MLNQTDLFSLPYLIKVGEIVGSQLTEEESAIASEEILLGYTPYAIAQEILGQRAFQSILSNQSKTTN
jgi:hypothetical protein